MDIIDIGSMIDPCPLGPRSAHLLTRGRWEPPQDQRRRPGSGLPFPGRFPVWPILKTGVNRRQDSSTTRNR